MGRGVDWFKKYSIEEVTHAFGDIEYEIRSYEDEESDGTSYGYGRTGRIQELLQKYTEKELPYNNNFYDTKEKAEEALIKPEELSKMFEETLKHVPEDDNVRGVYDGKTGCYYAIELRI